MKKKCLQFALQHMTGLVPSSLKYYFWMNLQFNSLQQKRKMSADLQEPDIIKKYMQETVKHLPSVMVWGAISIKGTARLLFLKLRTTMNGQRHLNLMKEATTECIDA